MKWFFSALALSLGASIYAQEKEKSSLSIEIFQQPTRITALSTLNTTTTQRNVYENHESAIPIEAASPYIESKSEALKYVLKRVKTFGEIAEAFDEGIGPNFTQSLNEGKLELKLRARKIDEVGVHLEVQNIIPFAQSSELTVTNQRATIAIKHYIKRGSALGEAGIYADQQFETSTKSADFRGYIGVSVRY